MPAKSCNSSIFVILLVSIFITIYIISDMNGNVSINQIDIQPFDLQSESDVIRNLSGNFACVDRPLESSVEERGNYLVYYNVISADKRFKCDESVTITTIGDFTFLDNIVPLVEKWQGPISVALYSPGSDFNDTLNSIDFLRKCTSSLVRELVTFHLFHERAHRPEGFIKGIMNFINTIQSDLDSTIDCALIPPYLNSTKDNTYRKEKKLQFGINIARNIARRGAQTHFFLASDLELYPSFGLINRFLTMIRITPALQVKKLAFVLGVFEVKENLTVPTNKSQLQEMFTRTDAVFFHDLFCSPCHSIPKKLEWIQSKSSEPGEINEFTRSKRVGELQIWEPFYIGTHADPMHDERIFWEGAGDKMVQAYAQCIMDYDFVILDNAFLVHKPGIKEHPSQISSERNVSKDKMLKLVKPELDALYGYSEGCEM